MERKDLRKKYIKNDDLFKAKATLIGDPKLKKDIEYHVLTGNCPYSKQECAPEGCRYGKDGIKKCPIH